MVNNINPTASKLLEQIKRLSEQTTKKEGVPIDFKGNVMKNHTRTVEELKRTDLLNSIERIQKKNNISATTPVDRKQEIFTINKQTSNWTKVLDAPKKHQSEPLGSLLDIYV